MNTTRSCYNLINPIFLQSLDSLSESHYTKCRWYKKLIFCTKTLLFSLIFFHFLKGREREKKKNTSYLNLKKLHFLMPLKCTTDMFCKMGRNIIFYVCLHRINNSLDKGQMIEFAYILT